MIKYFNNHDLLLIGTVIVRVSDIVAIDKERIILRHVSATVPLGMGEYEEILQVLGLT